MLSFNLAPIFRMRGIEKPYSFLVKAGLSPYTATTILNDMMHVLRLDHVELLCDLLVCEPNDLLAWQPDKNKIYPDNYPLAKLKFQPADTELADTLSKMSYKELKEVTQNIIQRQTAENVDEPHWKWSSLGKND